MHRTKIDFFDGYHCAIDFKELTDLQDLIRVTLLSYYKKPPDDHQDFSVESSDQSKALRFRFAGIGMIYDATNDVFYPPAPDTLPDGSPSGDTWVLNKTTWSWELPVPYPSDGYNYKWDNELYKSDNTKGWVLNMPDKPFASWVWEIEKALSEKPIGGHWAPPIPQPTDQKSAWAFVGLHRQMFVSWRRGRVSNKQPSW